MKYKSTTGNILPAPEQLLHHYRFHISLGMQTEMAWKVCSSQGTLPLVTYPKVAPRTVWSDTGE